jgi:hypothetical protein
MMTMSSSLPRKGKSRSQRISDRAPADHFSGLVAIAHGSNWPQTAMMADTAEVRLWPNVLQNYFTTTMSNIDSRTSTAAQH